MSSIRSSRLVFVEVLAAVTVTDTGVPRPLTSMVKVASAVN